MNAVILECIDGKDDHLQIPIDEGSTISLGLSDHEHHVLIKELHGLTGYVLVSNTHGSLYIDASNLSIAVKINGTPVTTGVIKNNDLLKIGDSVWKTLHEPTEVPIDGAITAQ